MKKVKVTYRQDKPKYYECVCGAEVIQVIRDYEKLEGEKKGLIQICLSMFAYGTKDKRYSLKNKLRHIWHIIKEGNPYSDSVILDVKTARRMGKDLLTMIKEG